MFNVILGLSGALVKIACNSKNTGRVEKNSGVVVTLYMGSFGALVSKWLLSRNGWSYSETLKSGTRARTCSTLSKSIFELGTSSKFDLKVLNVSFGVIWALVSKWFVSQRSLGVTDWIKILLELWTVTPDTLLSITV